MNETCELYNLIPKEKLKRIFGKSKTVGAECDHTFLGFEDVYKAVTMFVPKDKVIIDLGCAYAFQAWYFRDYRRYIGVDNGSYDALETLKEFEMVGADFYYTSIQRFIQGVLPTLGYTTDEVFAICSYVPDEEAQKMVRETFKNCLVYYP